MYKTIDIKNINYNKTFFHYTDKNNIQSIFEKGLLPKIGDNSKNIELNKKIFFTKGFDNTLFLMDAWIKWLMLRPKNNFIYKCGAFYMTHKIFPRVVVDILFKNWIKSKRKINYACKKLDYILENSVFLKLDLIENIDFSYDDCDEVKNQKFSRNQLSYVYTYGYDVNDKRIELWNMHTFKDKMVEKEKIKLISVGNSICAKDVVLFMADNSEFDIKEKCPFLYKYLEKYRNKQK